MSTYWRLYCTTHDDIYDGESINHGDDTLLAMIGMARGLMPWLDAEAMRAGVPDIELKIDGRYVPFWWLREHQHCQIGARSEYGEVKMPPPVEPEDERRARIIDGHFKEVDRLLRGYFAPLLVMRDEAE